MELAVEVSRAWSPGNKPDIVWEMYPKEACPIQAVQVG